MYKKDSMRVEDGIIPMLLESLLMAQMQHKASYKKRFKDHLAALREDIKKEIQGSKSATKTLLRIDTKVLKLFCDNGWCTRKCTMIVSYLAADIARCERVRLGDNTLVILFILNRWIRIASYNKVFGKDVKALDKSAAKQVNKVMKIILDEGYF